MPPLAASLPPEIIVFVVVFATLAATILSKPVRRRRLRQWYHHYRPSPRAAVPVSPDLSDPADQLRAVMTGKFTAKRVLSRTEAQVMAATEVAIAEAGLPWRVLAQVALGEVLASTDEAAFRAINAKRVDLLIVSERNMPLAAIEYQGQGHWQGSAPARDAVKKEALRRAGIGYIEITPAHDAADVRREVARLAVGAARAGARRITTAAC